MIVILVIIIIIITSIIIVIKIAIIKYRTLLSSLKINFDLILVAIFNVIIIVTLIGLTIMIFFLRIMIANIINAI